MKKSLLSLFVFLLFFAGPLYVLLSGQLVLNKDWRTASRQSAHLAPNPKNHKEAVVQIYAARTYGVRGVFGVHTWISVKPKNAKQYTVYQALGWNAFRKKPVVDVSYDVPDRFWFGQKPWVLYSSFGQSAEELIPKIQQLATVYPYQNYYQLWPGPNSNTFVSYVIRKIPSIKIRMPLTAIGKDYLIYSICTSALSKTGMQCSLKGILGFTLAKVEGLEFNILGWAFSLNFSYPFIHLPGID